MKFSTARQQKEISSSSRLLTLSLTVTGDDKGILYRNVKHRKTVCRVVESIPARKNFTSCITGCQGSSSLEVLVP